MIVTSAPGKLFIAGEYAVVQPGYPAILIAVDRFIEISLKRASKEGSISSYRRKAISWLRKDGMVLPSSQSNRYFHVLSAIHIVESYAREKGRKLDFYNLTISSQLESRKGLKYGLGSSAAVMVATIKALCRHYEIPVSSMELFKLSALAHFKINSSGSCGDIAASVYGGWTIFTTFDRDWLGERVRDSSISQILDMDWPKLSIRPIIAPEELELLVGWTGKPASTSRLVGYVDSRREGSNISYESFLDDSKNCVLKMLDAFEESNIEGIQQQLQVNRELLLDISGELGMEIETPLLKRLGDIALKYGGSGKPSGAGGGDCGIAIFRGSRYIDQVIGEWEKAGIRYLPLGVYDYKDIG